MRTLRSWKSYGAAAVIVGVLLTFLGAPPADATMISNKCTANLIFIGVRGTGAPAGSGSIESGRLWSSGGYGDQVQPLRDKWAGMSANMNIFAASLQYQASSNYVVSVNEGRDRLVAFLNSLPSCGFLPTIVLAGHSQGADVVAQALASQSLNSAVRSQVKAAVMYGDPDGINGANYLAPGSPYVVALATLGGRGGGIESVLQGGSYWIYGWPYQGSGPGWMSKIRSYCLQGDWACNGQPATSAQAQQIHNSYTTCTQSAYDWMFYMISNTN